MKKFIIYTPLRNRGSIPYRDRMFSFLPSVQTGAGAHTASSGYRGSSGRGVKLTSHI
jgi:hypothetical protein